MSKLITNGYISVSNIATPNIPALEAVTLTANEILL